MNIFIQKRFIPILLVVTTIFSMFYYYIFGIGSAAFVGSLIFIGSLFYKKLST